MQDFKDLGDKQEIDVSEMISKLNADQRRVFNRVTDTISSDKEILRLYVSGEGGTGKSFLIQTIKSWIKQNLNKDTAITAPTGMAAFNVNGLTAHRLFQLPVEHGRTPKYKPLADHVLKILRTDLKDVSLIVIDEVSMISNIFFMYINLRLCEIYNTTDCDDGWFGRKHVLLFGDLLQLPPVLEDPAFIHLTEEKVRKYLGSLSATNLWTNLFDYDELTINMRQQGDGSYRELLSRIRVGLLIPSDCDILEKRKISFKGEFFETRLNELCDFINNFTSIVCLLPNNHMCDQLNAAMLNRITSKEIFLIAEDTIDCISYMKKKVEKVLSNNDDDDTKTAGLSRRITIKIGAKIMIRRNIDASLGLVNGTIATVVSVSQDKTTDYIEKIKVRLPSDLEYFIERVSVKFPVMDRVYVTRKQFPLSLSYGITIHKSQGLSLQNAVMDLGNNVFSCGQVYVALSRVTSLDGLHLINFDPSSVFASEIAIIEYNRLKRIGKPESEIISISKQRYRKVRDVSWTLSKIITSVQESGQKEAPIKRTAWIIRGFQNIDKVSCYANATLQCLLNLYTFRKELLNYDKLDVLNLFAHQYEHGTSNLNTYDIRQSLGEYFSTIIKRNALEFLTALCTKYDYIKSMVEHKVICNYRCYSCGNTKVITNNNVILSLSINNVKKKSYNLNDLLKTTFSSSWCQTFDKLCERCGRNDVLFKSELVPPKEILIINLTSFSSEDGKSEKIPHKFSLCSVPTTKIIIIAGQTYKVMSAIFHYGSCIDEGHYTSMCKEGTSWIEIDDVQVIKRQWPRGAKDISILFLQKNISKNI
ncbi:ATP-dependent DNA helicase PIF1 [Cyphomyrmex costatus]|uniref:ATP-dependent DNA helicase n=1 Tax=Cyphomyrmex costatus TaxID=456900 RepID=A0A151IDD7_9HYME|nr:ATP-dependent DNA helicase PIF1 [Cyphomyrmex costatus]